MVNIFLCLFIFLFNFNFFQAVQGWRQMPGTPTPNQITRAVICSSYHVKHRRHIFTTSDNLCYYTRVSASVSESRLQWPNHSNAYTFYYNEFIQMDCAGTN
jgi:hypothetical protein